MKVDSCVPRLRRFQGAMRCDERRSSAIDGVIVLDVEPTKRGSFERIDARRHAMRLC